jgi:hypothetical protein
MHTVMMFERAVGAVKDAEAKFCAPRGYELTIPFDEASP